MGLGLAEPGFATACFVEIDEYPRQTLIAGQRAGYLHTAPIWDDLKRFSGLPWRGQIDTLLAGYPCQPFSQAGQRKGEDDPRHLWPDIERIIGELGDGLEWCFFENVAGHLTLGLETVVRALQRMGFGVAVGLFSAEETGATHERQRVFIVAHRSRERRQQVARSAYDDEAAHEGRAEEHDHKPAGAGADLADGGGVGRERGAQRHRAAQPSGPAQRRDDVERCGVELADADGGAVELVHTGCSERGPRNAERHDDDGPENGRNERSGRACKPGADVDDAAGPRRDGPRQRPGPDVEGRECLPGAGRGELADGDHPGPQGQRRDVDHQERRQEPARHAGLRSGAGLHPPGPADMDAWRHVLALYPDGAPALSLGDLSTFSRYFAALVEAGQLSEAEAERRLRLMADGLARRSRALRLLGNGVHPLAAGHAWRTLSSALGLGRVDLDAAEGSRSAEAAGAI